MFNRHRVLIFAYSHFDFVTFKVALHLRCVCVRITNVIKSASAAFRIGIVFVAGDSLASLMFNGRGRGLQPGRQQLAPGRYLYAHMRTAGSRKRTV